MPIDFDLSAGGMSGLESGKGKGKFSGMPEGSSKSGPKPTMMSHGGGLRGHGITGTPNGISGKARKMKMGSMGSAIKRRLKG